MPVTVSYDGSTILSLSTSANYKLLTNGKVLEDDVLVSYTSPQVIPIEETTAVAGDVVQGKYFFDVSGTKTLGTLVPAYTLLAEEELQVNTSSTSPAQIKTIALGSSNWTSAKMLYVRIRDTRGSAWDYGYQDQFIASDTWLLNYRAANNETPSYQTLELTTAARAITKRTRSSTTPFATNTFGDTTGYGIYAYSIAYDGTLSIYRCYASAYSGVINGTYNIKVYGLLYAPEQGDPYDFTFVV